MPTTARESASVADFRLAVFEQSGAALGPVRLLELSTAFMLLTSLKHPFESRHFCEVKVYSTTRGRHGTHLPVIHELGYHKQLTDETLLCETLLDKSGLGRVERALGEGQAVQVFLWNHDGECIRHYLVLPLPLPSVWM